MEAGGKECEEDTLQTAFKKLRVDAESLPGAASASEAVSPRAVSRSCDANGAKPKLVSPKDNWHGCTRKTSRGASRTQRRRRSKSPILQAPKFTYCSPPASALSGPPLSGSALSALSAPSVCLKHQRITPPEPEPAAEEGTTLSSAAQKELSSSGTQSHLTPLVFGSSAAYTTPLRASLLPLQDTPTSHTQPIEERGAERSACERGAPPTGAPDFRALSELSNTSQNPQSQCSCLHTNPDPKLGGDANPLQCICQPSSTWGDLQVYSFSGLRNVISECEPGDPPRTAPAGSPRSCSEQARAYVDDITIEDLSGYMEFYLYIPKKMSHMAEMMYT